MRKEKGITMVSLVVTIIILIILAGISIQVTIGENGIITKAKQAKQNITLAGEAEAIQLNQLYYELETGGEMSEDEESTKKDEIINLLQKQVEELQKQVASLQTENAELKKQIQDLNVQIANLQTEIADLKAQIASKDIEIANLKKQVSEKEAKIQDLQNQLNSLNSLLAQTNATADKILSGYKAYSGGKLLTGTMVNRGAVSSNLNAGQSYTIPAGYHSGSGKITANSLESQTQATATANNLSNGKTAWVNGVKITGNGADVNNAYNNGYNAGYAQMKSNSVVYTFGAGTYNLSDSSKPYYVKDYAKLTNNHFYGSSSWSVNVNFHHTDTADHSYSASGGVSFSYNPNTAILTVTVNSMNSGNITLVYIN